MKIVVWSLIALVLLTTLGSLLGTYLRWKDTPLGSDEDPMFESCVCGHPWVVHSHHRRGRDCSVCGAVICGRFEPIHRGTWWEEIKKNFRRGERHG